MSRITLKSLSIGGFRSFLDSSKVEFPAAGSVAIHGNDTRTASSNGTGKSTVLEAIYWLLGLNTLSYSDLKNYASEKAVGELTMDVDGVEWVIERAGDKARLTIDGKEVARLKKAIDEKLTSMASGHLDILEVLSYRRQSSGGYFFKVGDTALKEFLVKCLPELTSIENAISASDDGISLLKTQLEKMDGALEVLRQELPPDSTILALQGEMSSRAKTVETLRAALEATTNDRSLVLGRFMAAAGNEAEARSYVTGEYKTAFASQKAEISSRQENLGPEAESTIATLEMEIAEGKATWESMGIARSTMTAQKAALVKEIETLSKIESEKTAIANRIADANRMVDNHLININKMDASKCFTCEQPWHGAAAHRSKLLGDVEQLKRFAALSAKSITELDVKLSAVVPLKDQRDALETEIQKRTLSEWQIRERIIKAETQIAEIKKTGGQAKIIALQTLALQKAEFVRKYSTIMSKIESETEASISASRLALAEAEAAYKSSSVQVQSIEEARKRLAEKIKGRQEVAANKDYEDFLNSILRYLLSMLLDGVLKETEAGANAFLARIPNCADIAISIDTVTENKKGGTRARISSKILKSGYPISFQALSGGQQSAVSLFTDISFRQALKLRTGISPMWLALDEPMDGMDNVSKEAAFEVLREAAPNELLLVIEHSSEIKELYDGAINVVFDGRSSRIV